MEKPGKKKSQLTNIRILGLLLVMSVAIPQQASALPPSYKGKVVSNARIKKAVRAERTRWLNPKNWRTKKAKDKKSLAKKVATTTMLGVIGAALVLNPLAANASTAPAPSAMQKPAHVMVLKEVPKPKMELKAKVARPQKQVQADQAQDKSRGAAIVTKLYEQVRGYLISAAQKQVFKEHKLKVYDVKVGEHAGVGFQVKAEPLKSTDALVAKDALRKQLTDQAKKAGKPLTWGVTGGGVYPSAGFSIPLGNFSVGFSADALLNYTVLAPYAHVSAGSVVDMARNNTVDLPLNGQKALAMKPGTEVLIQGKARFIAHGSGGTGETVLSLGSFATVGTRVGVSTSIPAEVHVQLKIKRLQGDKVQVTVSELKGAGVHVSTGAHAGVDAHVGKGMPVKLDNKLAARGAKMITSRIDKTLEKYLQVGVRAGHNTSATKREISNYTMDLKKPGVEKAYKSMFKLDARKADRLVARDGSGVVRARLIDRTVVRSDSMRANVGPFTVMSAISQSTERHGTLQTGAGTIHYSRAKLDDGYSMILSNIWLGKRNISRELVSVKMPGQERAENYIHVRYTVKKDRVTSKEDVRRFVNLAELLGAKTEDGKAPRVKKMGKTDRVVDVYISDAGLQRLAKASPAQLEKAFSDAYTRIDRPGNINYLIGGDKGVWKVNPWMAKDHARHADLMSMLEKGPQKQSGPRTKRVHSGITRDSKYRYITGRSLAYDSAAYKEYKGLVKLVDALKGAQTPKARAKVFARADKDLGLEFMRELGMISKVAGADQVLVNQLYIKGKGNKQVRFSHEGMIKDIQATIDARLANPR